MSKKTFEYTPVEHEGTGDIWILKSLETGVVGVKRLRSDAVPKSDEWPTLIYEVGRELEYYQSYQQAFAVYPFLP